jgi:transposase
MSDIKVITSVQRRRRWSAEEKRAIVEETEQPGMSISAVARKSDINPNQLFNWRRLMRQGALEAIKRGERVVPESEVKLLKAKIKELERMLGKKTMEAEILEEALEIAREKNSCCGSPGRTRKILREKSGRNIGGFPIPGVCRKPGWKIGGGWASKNDLPSSRAKRPLQDVG